ncbi:Tat pathway signal sequence domain protein [Sphingomonas naasensis]|uniref:Tat pathway signal sequence domain protein n=2 Tax=Sphingomonas naasensis TaxID=1344951 RepID=A0A4S1WFE1_9SPHN|nr:Tat pathway signal sequence domain protein [Sphingomonas naasensis]
MKPAGHNGAGALRRAALALGLLAAGCAPAPRPTAPRPAAADWRIEAEQAARVSFGDTIDIETPAGLSLWYTRELRGPVAIEFDALAVSEGGANDQVSDLNAFWMARDPQARGGSVFARKRSGAFADYDDLTTYYVGIGGNRNTTTRFRRYVGQPGNRPLLPEHDLADAANLLVPNRWTHVRLIADARHIAVERDGRQIFALDDAQPYRKGWFALRTTKSHLRIRNLRIGKP